MKLKITPTPAGTGYRAECLDLPGTPPVGEGKTEREAIARCLYRWFTLLTDAQLDAVAPAEPIPPAPPPAVGVSLEACKTMLWERENHVNYASTTRMFKEAVEAAERGKVYVDTWPSRGVPVELCDHACALAEDALANQQTWINPEWPEKLREFVAAVEAARRGEWAHKHQCSTDCIHELEQSVEQAEERANENAKQLAAAQAEVERLESLVYKRMENEQLNLACRFRLAHMAGVPQGEVGEHSDMNLVEKVYQKLLAESGGNSVGE